MEILTGEQMRQADRHAIEELGVPGLLLMEAAGRGVAARLLRHWPDAVDGRVVVLCGKGNNGGDGFVVARYLSRRGANVQCWLFGPADELRGDAAVNRRAAATSGVPVVEVLSEPDWKARLASIQAGQIVVDALLGTGVRGGARGLLATVIADVNRSGARIVAVDLPSGLDADGSAEPVACVRATLTLTLCRPKVGLYFGAGEAAVGRVEVVPIGIPDEAVRRIGSRLSLLDAAELRPLLPPRRPDAHKGDFGHLLVIAGGEGKLGAGLLAGRAALRGGAGLVTLACPGAPFPASLAVPELMTADVGGADPAIAASLLAERDAAVIGPGLGTGPGVRELVDALIASDRPMAIDADGLNVLAGEPGALRGRSAPTVITPHPGEAGRLLGRSSREVQQDRRAAAGRLAEESGAIVVLKGHRTLVAFPDGHIAVNPTGNPGMATAGSGDVLSGLVGALLARPGLDAGDAARLAVYLHGRAGDFAADRVGVESLVAGDIIESLPEAIVGLFSGTEEESHPW